MRIYVLVEDRGHLGYCYSGGCIPLLLKHGLSLAQGWPLSRHLLSSIGIKSGPPCLSVFLFFSHTGYKDQTQVLMVARSNACTLLTELSHTLATTLMVNPKGGEVCPLQSMTELSLEVTETSQILPDV